MSNNTWAGPERSVVDWTGPMPAYHFHVNDLLDPWDNDGQEFADDAAANVEARRAFSEILQFESGFAATGQLRLSVLQGDRLVMDLVATALTPSVDPSRDGIRPRVD